MFTFLKVSLKSTTLVPRTQEAVAGPPHRLSTFARDIFPPPPPPPKQILWLSMYSGSLTLEYLPSRSSTAPMLLFPTSYVHAHHRRPVCTGRMWLGADRKIPSETQQAILVQRPSPGSAGLLLLLLLPQANCNTITATTTVATTATSTTEAT